MLDRDTRSIWGSLFGVRTGSLDVMGSEGSEGRGMGTEGAPLAAGADVMHAEMLERSAALKRDDPWPALIFFSPHATGYR